MYGYAYIVTLMDNSEHVVFTPSFHENHTGVYFRQHLAEGLRSSRKVNGPMPEIRQFRFGWLVEVHRLERTSPIREPPVDAVTSGSINFAAIVNGRSADRVNGLSPLGH